MNTKLVSLFTALTLAGTLGVRAQSTAFTYQGRLTDNGVPATGRYDFRGALFASAGGDILVGATNTVSYVPVSNGQFTIQLDFGDAWTVGGAVRWLELAVRTNGAAGNFSPLAARQPLTPTPMALWAGLAGTAYGVASNTIASAALQDGAVAPAKLNTAGAQPGQGLVFDGGAMAWTTLSADWSRNGNNAAPGEFLGTVNNRPLELKVNGLRVLRIEPGTEKPYGTYGLPALSPNLIGGYSGNIVSNGLIGATIGGGGVPDISGTGPSPNQVVSDFGTVGGGFGNSAGEQGAVAGGAYNQASGFGATVGGGRENRATGLHATVSGGGGGSYGGNQATGEASTVGGGQGNIASGLAAVVAAGALNQATNRFATVGGGFGNTAGGASSTVCGGHGNIATAPSATVAGGLGNSLDQSFGTICGGDNNNMFFGTHSAIAGGFRNVINGSHASIGGGFNNEIGYRILQSNGDNGNYATIGGGMLNRLYGEGSTIGGGRNNWIGGDGSAGAAWATVGGGLANVVQAIFGTISGGGPSNTNDLNTTRNRVTDAYGTVAGGGYNQAGDGDPDVGNATFASVGGGYHNFASGHAATVPGGADNLASGAYSFAAGRSAKADHRGSFVWADSQANREVHSQYDDQFLVRAYNGARFEDGAALWVEFNRLAARPIDTSTTAYLSSGGTWQNASDIARKENLHPVNPIAILDQVVRLPLTTWNYRDEGASTRHLGPTAQDFRAAFSLGAGDKHIATVDADGVALAAIQGLNQKLEEMRADNAELKRRLERLESLLERGAFTVAGGAQ